MSSANQPDSYRFRWLLQWIEPELFQPIVFGFLICLALSEFVRGALTLSLLPIYGQSVLALAVEWTTLSISIQSAVDNVFRSGVGLLIDRFGERPLLIAGFALSTVAVFLMMHVHNLAGLLGCAALFGVSVTPVWPSAFAGISRYTPEAKRASFMGYVYIFWLIGMGLGPVITNFTIGYTFSLAFWILTALEAVALIIALVIVPKRMPTAGPNQIGSAATTDTVASPTRTRRDAAYWRSVIANMKDVAFLFPGMFVQTFAVSALIPVLSLYAKLVLHVSPALFSSVLVVGGAVTAIGLIPSGKVVSRTGTRRVLVPGFLVAGSSLILFPAHPTLPLAYALMALLGLCYAFILPAWNAVLDKSIDSDKKATLWGVFMTVEGAGSSIGPFVGGLVWDKFSPAAPFLLSGGVIAAMGLLYLVIPLDMLRGRASVEEEFALPARRKVRG